MAAELKTREKLIRCLKYCASTTDTGNDCLGCERWEYDCGSAHCVDDLMEQAAEALEQQKWIPFAEKLPEQSGYYLTITTNGNHIVAPYSARHKAFNAFDTDHDARFEIACTHWMPLPEPPKGE